MLWVVIIICTIFQANAESFTNRHLLANNKAGNNVTGGTVIVKEGCLIFYLNSLSIAPNKKGEAATTITEAADTSKTECKNGTNSALLVLDWPKIDKSNGSIASLTLKFNLTKNSLQWCIRGGSIDTTCASTDKCVPQKNKKLKGLDGICASKGYSYNCNMQRGFKTGDVNLLLNKMQLQFGNFKDGKFSESSDCVGFFSIGTLTVIVVSLVLSLILAYGITMLSNIATPDRFDDSKSKGLQIHSTD